MKFRLILACSLIVMTCLLGALPAFAGGTFVYSKSNIGIGAVPYCQNTGSGVVCVYYFPIVTLVSTVTGQDVSSGFNTIQITYHNVSGDIKSVDSYPFNQAAQIYQGQFREAALPGYIVDWQYNQSNLTLNSGFVFPPGDQPWQGGYEYATFGMNGMVADTEAITIAYAASDVDMYWSTNTQVSWTFHSQNGWQSVSQ